MAWILLEGLDRSGKSSVAGYYTNQGYEVVHLEAPHKKFTTTGYSGPSYLEEMVEIYSLYAGKDVVFDRTCYGELIWPEVFNRMPLLNDEDLEYLSQLEYNQSAVKYLLTDSDAEAHWKRCVDNKEPINRIQFVQAGRLYDKLENERGFERKQLGDFSALAAEDKQTKKNKKTKKTLQKNDEGPERDAGNIEDASSDRGSDIKSVSMSAKLDKANAIKAILDSKIIKKKGTTYDDLEQDIRRFLSIELEELFEPKKGNNFTADEVTILKSMAQRIREKME